MMAFHQIFSLTSSPIQINLSELHFHVLFGRPLLPEEFI